MAKSESKVEVKKAAQEIMQKAPPGYRLATPEEELEILKRGNAINMADSTLRRCEAEIRAAQAESREAQKNLTALQAGLKELHARLGIEGNPDDLLTFPDGRVAVLVDRAKRDSHLKLLQGGKAPAKKEEAPPEKKEPEKK